VIVDNNGPPPPTGLTATLQPGSTAIALTWSNPANPPAPISSAMAQLCTATCTPATPVDPAQATLTAPGPGIYSARVWLLDTAGRGGPHNAAAATVTIPASTTTPTTPRTHITATLKGRRLRVSGPIAQTGRVSVSWRSKIRGRTAGHGTRTVTIHDHRLRATFFIPRRARTHRATIRVAIRSHRRVIGQARARRSG
jgi:hypothetical protein